ncbi:MAG: THUMP domain-containing protein [Planctomycetota bacterium]
MPDLLITSASGLEAVVARELQSLGYESQILQSGRQLIQAEPRDIAVTNLHLRVAERVLVRVGCYRATDFEALFDQAVALPWEQWIPIDGRFPVRGRSIKSQLASVPALQRAINRAVAQRLMSAHSVSTLPETGPLYSIEVALLKNEVTLTIDTTGVGLHKRGYRPAAGKAPLRETLAAALVLLSRWTPDRPLIDPFCGLGTIPIEAAMLGRAIAPGYQRQFAAEEWPLFKTSGIWETVRAEAAAQVIPELPQRILGSDIDGSRRRRNLALGPKRSRACHR